MKFLHNYPKEVNVFLAASLVNSAGGSLMWPLISMYVFDELGKSMAAAGFVILVQSVGAILGQLAGGALYHKLGVKKLIVGAILANALALFALPLLSLYWIPFIVTMGLIGFFNAMSFPAIQAFIGFRFADRRAELFNVTYVASNIGIAIGTALSGFLADVSYSLSFILNGLSSVVFAAFFFVYLRKIRMPDFAAAPSPGRDSNPASANGPGKRPKAAGGGFWPLLANTRVYLFMSIGTLLIYLGNSMWNTGISPSIISEGLPKSMYGFLWTLNGILIFVAQPVTMLIKRFAARTVTSQMTGSGLLYMFGFFIILLLPSYTGMVIGMTFVTLGEMLIAPATPAFISEHAGKNAPFYIGLTGGISAIGRVIGPYVMGSLYDHGGLAPVLRLAVFAGLASALFFMLHTRLNRPIAAAVAREA
ncbi:MFS transporter [Paenibacillus protaetiae]|uniref:MFS transporter n=1 Tax=Paenibacillus protaetiae TaxID=2509456 RepID=A0A4P6EXA0_9BACL|nr:MFS transporter [Paenibacillus protaetiae]QAY68030.1 MFS transporter [Paenibacillus protaetiae]